MAIMSGFISGGVIQPYRFVRITATNTVSQASASTQRVIGISQDFARNAPVDGASTAAATAAGQEIMVYGLGEECLLELNATLSAGDLVCPDADGKGVAAASTYFVGATLVESGVAGDLRRVIVKPSDNAIV